MRLKEMALGEFLGLCRRKLAQGKGKFSIFLPPNILPPRNFKAYKRTVVRDDVAGVVYEILTRPNVDGGWILKVLVKEEPFNTIPIGEALKEITTTK